MRRRKRSRRRGGEGGEEELIIKNKDQPVSFLTKDALPCHVMTSEPFSVISWIIFAMIH